MGVSVSVGPGRHTTKHFRFIIKKCPIKEDLQDNQVVILDHQVLRVLLVLMEDLHLATLDLQDSRLIMVPLVLDKDLKWCLFLSEGKVRDLLVHQEDQRDPADLHSTNQRELKRRRSSLTRFCHRRGESWCPSPRLTWTCWLLRGSWTLPL